MAIDVKDVSPQEIKDFLGGKNPRSGDRTLIINSGEIESARGNTEENQLPGPTHFQNVISTPKDAGRTVNNQVESPPPQSKPRAYPHIKNNEMV